MQVLSFSQDGMGFNLSSEAVEAQAARFTVIIGKNGSGKSRLLRAVADGCLKRNDGALRYRGDRPPNQLLAVSNLVTDVFRLEAIKQQSGVSPRPQYRYLGLRQATNAVTTGALRDATALNVVACLSDPRRRDGLHSTLQVFDKTDSDIKVAFKSLRSRKSDEKRTLEMLLHAEDVSSPAAAASALLGLISRFGDVPTLQGLEELADFAEVIDSDVPSLIAALKRSGTAMLDVALIRNGRQVEVSELSTGELLMLSTNARIVANIEPQSLVLIDEPEIGLHPNWQISFVDVLRTALRNFPGCHVFIATHSPHLVGDATDVLVPGNEWGEFNEFEDPFRGRSIDNILYRVFGSIANSSLVVERDVTDLLEFVAGGGRTYSEGLANARRRLQRVAGSDTRELNILLRDLSRRLDEDR